jgi:hypothetical protein
LTNKSEGSKIFLGAKGVGVGVGGGGKIIFTQMRISTIREISNNKKALVVFVVFIAYILLAWRIFIHKKDWKTLHSSYPVKVLFWARLHHVELLDIIEISWTMIVFPNVI